MKEKISSYIKQNYTAKDLYFIKQIVVFYAVGIIGFLLPFSNRFFTKLTPVALILSAVLLFYYNENRINGKSAAYFVFVFVASFFIEAIGVKTGKLFGNYYYGNGLSVKLFETPIIIGLNWVLMIYLTSAVFGKNSRNLIWQVVFSSALMILYDVILEPSASKMDMWFWQDNQIPLQNFMMWGLIAFVFQSVKFALKIEIKNKMALPLLIVQMLFFLIIQII